MNLLQINWIESIISAINKLEVYDLGPKILCRRFQAEVNIRHESEEVTNETYLVLPHGWPDDSYVIIRNQHINSMRLLVDVEIIAPHLPLPQGRLRLGGSEIRLHPYVTQ